MSTTLSSAVRSHLMSSKVRLQRPSMTTLRLLQAILRPNIRGEMVLRIIQDDGALVARVLRAANGAATGEEIYSLRAATNTSTGARRIARLGVAVSMSPLYMAPGLDRYAQHIGFEARLSAVYAEELARRLGEHTELSYLCGLFMNSGQLQVLQAIGLALNTNKDASEEEITTLLKILGPTVGEKVARAWKIPKPVAAAMGNTKKLEDDNPYIKCVQIGILGRLMALSEGSPDQETLAADLTASAEMFPTHLIRLLGARHDEFSERAEAMSGDRVRKRLAA